MYRGGWGSPLARSNAVTHPPKSARLHAGTLPPAPEEAAAAARRDRSRLVVLLAVTSGATDAIGFLALGSAFTSVMTGNMVLFGIAAAHQNPQDLALVAVAIVSYVVGAATGARVCGTHREGDGVWPPAVTRGLRVELALFTLFAISWWALGSEPPEHLFLPLLAVNASALGIQSSAIQRFGVPGLSTTYLTGTLTTVTIRLVSGQGLRSVRHSLSILTGLIGGAGLGAVLVRFAAVAVPLVQLLTVGGVLLLVRLRRPREA